MHALTGGSNIAVDMGIIPSAAAPLAHATPMSVMDAPYRILIRDSRMLVANGYDGRLALNRLRPSIDSPNEQVRAHATLSNREWLMFDEAVGAASQETMTGVSDLLSRGLRLTIQNPFGTPIIEAERVSEMTAANVSMYAGTPPTDDRVEYTLWGIPVPIISKGFWLDERVLEASRQRGQSLDVTNADAATRVVAEKMEELLFTGGSVTYGGYTLTGYTNSTGVNTGSLSGSWLTLSSTAPMKIVSDIINMKQQLTNDFATGPYVLYIPRAWIDALDRGYFEYTTTSPALATGVVASTQTIRQRIMQLSEISDVRPTTQLTTGVVLVSMTRNTVDWAFGFEPRLVSWQSQGGMVNHFRVIAIGAPRVKSDYAGHSGVAYFTTG